MSIQTRRNFPFLAVSFGDRQIISAVGPACNPAAPPTTRPPGHPLPLIDVSATATKPFFEENTRRFRGFFEDPFSILHHSRQTAEVAKMKNCGIVGKSEAVARLREMIRIAARSQDTVLLLGERGSGKDLVAKAIHQAAGRPMENWTLVCCGALTDSLAESELFGHVQGAFTGARDSRAGLVRHAKGGTLFLNEIGVLPLRLQAKFLHLIEEKEYRPVGGTRMVRLEAEIIAATNLDLYQAARENRFLPDLLDRLNVLPVSLPPLRERREDIPLLLRHFFGRANRYDLWRRLSPAVLEFLAAQNWPGNVRQLRNLVTRVVICGGGCADSVNEMRQQYVVGEVISPGSPASAAPAQCTSTSWTAACQSGSRS
jgi:transcriptional regulator with GAF, ATPase, and Fis domain